MYGLIVDYFLGNIPVWVWPFVAGGGVAGAVEGDVLRSDVEAGGSVDGVVAG